MYLRNNYRAIHLPTQCHSGKAFAVFVVNPPFDFKRGPFFLNDFSNKKIIFDQSQKNHGGELRTR